MLLGNVWGQYIHLPVVLYFVVDALSNNNKLSKSRWTHAREKKFMHMKPPLSVWDTKTSPVRFCHNPLR